MISVETPAQGEYKDYFFTVDENYVVTIGGKSNAIKPKIELTKDTEEVLEEITIKVKVTTEDGTIEEVTKPDGTKTTETEFEYKVKENKTYTFVAKGSNGGRAVESIEITNVKEIIAEPIIKSNFGYPVLKSTGISVDNTVSIMYDNKAGLENYYSIDNGITWNKYMGSFNVTQESTIKAKSVKNGVTLAETSIDIIMPKDALSSGAYDGDEVTFDGRWFPSEAHYLIVDSKMWNKELKFITNGSPGVRDLKVNFLNEKNELIRLDAVVETSILDIPEGTYRINLTEGGHGGELKLYEIQVLN